MKKMVIFGGTGGLGSQLVECLNSNYQIIALSSSDCDVSDLRACESFFKENACDVVVNLSGVNYDKFVHKMNSGDEVAVKRMINVNIIGTVNVVAACLPSMRSNGFGRIILTSSVLATKNMLGTALYSASKAFIDKFAQNVSFENSRKGVTANSIQLGYFDGGLTHRIPIDIQEHIKSGIGLGRWGRIDELANTIDFIVKTEYLTGSAVRIDGGV
jgi:NAD(P)-dependent dehydrogenase (short-subunit alcohol dehydrogenase family)